MLLILPPGGKLILQDHVFGRIAYALLFGLWAVKFTLLILPSGREAHYARSDVRTDSLCSFIWPTGGKIYASHSASGREAYYTRSGVRPASLCSFIWPPGGKFMFLILPPGGKLILQDHVFGQIANAPSFGLRAVSLCF